MMLATQYSTPSAQVAAPRRELPAKHKPNTRDSGITEILMPYGEDISMVLPMLASMSQLSEEAGKWLTWVVPKSFNTQMLKQYGFATKHIRLVQSEHRDDSLWYTWEALSKGNSGYVVAMVDSLSDTERTKLEQASTNGNTRGLILGSR